MASTNHRCNILCRRHQEVISLLLWELLKQRKRHFWAFTGGAVISQSTSSPSSRDKQSCWKRKPASRSQNEWTDSDRGSSTILPTLNSSGDQEEKCWNTLLCLHLNPPDVLWWNTAVVNTIWRCVYWCVKHTFPSVDTGEKKTFVQREQTESWWISTH